MDLRRRLGRWALARPPVLLVDAPGNRRLGWRVEAELDRRHWPLALSPADTDLLLVVGEPGPQLRAAVEALWSQTPLPRHRHHIRQVGELAGQLDAAMAALTARGTALAPARPTPRDLLLNGAGHQAPGRAADGHAGPADGHEGHGMHHGGEVGDPAPGDGHEGHDMHHGGEVAGLAMAGTAPDRDGLTLDSLQVCLGPVLPAWPTGLMVRGSLQGDILTDVDVSWADPADRTAGDAGADGDAEADGDAYVVALSQLAQFLLIAGWPVAARSARLARSAVLSPEPARAAQGRRAAARLAHRVRRSRTLAWSVRRLGLASASAATDGTGWPDGDVLNRVRQWCDLAAGDGTHLPVGPSLADLAVRLEGAELAAVRLIVASVDMNPAAAGAPRGSGV